MGSEQVIWSIGTTFTLLTIWVVLAAALFADLVVDIAGPDYADAEPLIPCVAAGFALHGLFVLTYRTSEFPDKRQWFVRAALTAAGTFLATAVATIPLLDLYGAPLAVAAGWSAGIALMRWRARRAGNPFPIHAGKAAAGMVAAVVCFGLSSVLADAIGDFAADLAGFAVYPLLLMGLGIWRWRVVAPYAALALRRRPMSS